MCTKTDCPLLIIHCLLIAQLFIWPSISQDPDKATDSKVGSLRRDNGPFMEVKTESGWIRGNVTKVHDVDIVSFLGVPYAKPTTGERRFAGPESPADSWSGIRDALEYGPDCYSIRDDAFPGFKGADMWNTELPFSEDCLNVNIWAPKNAHNATVLVWIFGGGFFSGSPSLELYEGSILAATGHVVVVNINYRLGPFGFMYLGDETANVGLRDQQAALKWLNRNLPAFGGDPTRVMLFSESAGSASVSSHFFAEDSWPYFKYGVLQSGAIICPWATKTIEQARNTAKKFLARLGCANETSDAGRLQCARKVDAKLMHDAYKKSIDDTTFMEFDFVPVVEDSMFFKGNVRKLLEQGKFKKTSMIIGTMEDEGPFWLPYYLSDYFNTTSESLINRKEYAQCVDRAFKDYYYFPPVIRKSITYHYINSILEEESTDPWHIPKHIYRNAIGKIVGDFLFTCGTLDLADQMSERGALVYVYYFKERSTANTWPKWMGAMHGYEIEYMFGVPLKKPEAYTKEELKFSKRVMHYWVHFAKHGKPTMDPEDHPNHKSDTRHHHRRSSDYHWPVYDHQKKYMILHSAHVNSPDELIGQRKITEDDCAFWKNITKQCQGEKFGGMPGEWSGNTNASPRQINVKNSLLQMLAIGLILHILCKYTYSLFIAADFRMDFIHMRLQDGIC